LQIRGIALNQLAPFLIPEEECLAFGVDAGDEQRAAGIDAEDVVIQLRAGGAIPVVLVAICIVGCVAVELPCFAMVVLGAALE